MNRIKINNGLAAAIILLSMFAGWGTLLLVTVLMLIFCETDDKFKGIAIRVIAFMAGLALVGYAWDIIYEGIRLVISGIRTLITTLNYYLDDPISILKLEQYLINPVNGILTFLNSVVAYLLMLAKFGFVVATLSGKAVKENIVIKKINEYVSKVVNYVSNIDASSTAKAAEPEMPQQAN